MALKHYKTNGVWPAVIGFITLAATYGGAIGAVLTDQTLAMAIGWTFLSLKGTMLLATLLGIMRRPQLGWKLFRGRYTFDHKHPRRAAVQAFTRFWWELPQLWLGYMVSQWRNMFGQIDRVETVGGVTFAIEDGRNDGMCKGLSLGSSVNIWLTDHIEGDFQTYVRNGAAQMLMHEFGHTLDSMRLGWGYLIVVGIPSLLSQMTETALHGRHYRHSRLYAERWANKHAQHYFGIRMRDLETDRSDNH